MDDLELFARTIQCEAGGEGDSGMKAVASVIMNRVNVSYGEYGRKYKELKNSREAERSAVEKELAELEKAVDPAWMEKYKAKRKDKMFPVLYEVKGNMCGNCRMELSMAELNRLKNEEIIECDNCRCLLSKS